MKTKKYLIQNSIMLLCLAMPAIVFAQPDFTDEVTDVPIDGGLSLLVAAGIGYAGKQLKQRK